MPPTIAQHAKAWIMHEWNDPRRRRNAHAECEDVLHPYSLQPECDRITGVYREGAWVVYVSAQTRNPNQPLRVTIGNPAYTPADPVDDNKRSLTKAMLKVPLMVFGKF
jgi:hypothetical protein